MPSFSQSIRPVWPRRRTSLTSVPFDRQHWNARGHSVLSLICLMCSSDVSICDHPQRRCRHSVAWLSLTPPGPPMRPTRHRRRILRMALTSGICRLLVGPHGRRCRQYLYSPFAIRRTPEGLIRLQIDKCDRVQQRVATCKGVEQPNRFAFGR